eukprot:GEMP01001332.1.p1 GENE.GEMP01001332.1~~GEMP01001332.1.p1  ORF type:complete len:1645 (+),score=361.12 GEMP01001332.1:210-5144(+)
MNVAQCIESLRDSLPSSQLCEPQNSNVEPCAALCMLNVHPDNKHIPKACRGTGVSRSGKDGKACRMLGSEKKKIGIAVYRLLKKIGVPCKANIEPSVFTRTKTLNHALCELCYVTYPVDALRLEKKSVDGHTEDRVDMEFAMRRHASREAMFARLKRENERLMRELDNEKETRLKVEQRLAENTLTLGMVKTDLQSLQDVHHADQKRWKKRLEKEIQRTDVSIDSQASQRMKAAVCVRRRENSPTPSWVLHRDPSNPSSPKQRKPMLDLKIRSAASDSPPSIAAPQSSYPPAHSTTVLEAMSAASTTPPAEAAGVRWAPHVRAQPMQYTSTLLPATPSAMASRHDPSLPGGAGSYVRGPQGGVASPSFGDISRAEEHERRTSASAVRSSSPAARQAVSQRCRKTLTRSVPPPCFASLSSNAVLRAWDDNETLHGALQSRTDDVYAVGTRTSSEAYRPRSVEHSVKGTAPNIVGGASEYRRERNRGSEALHVAYHRGGTWTCDGCEEAYSRTDSWEGEDMPGERCVGRYEDGCDERSNDICCGEQEGEDGQDLHGEDNWSDRVGILNSVKHGVLEEQKKRLHRSYSREFSADEVQHDTGNGRKSVEEENSHIGGVWSTTSTTSSCAGKSRDECTRLTKNRTKAGRGQLMSGTSTEEEHINHRLTRQIDEESRDGKKRSSWTPSEDERYDILKREDTFSSDSKQDGRRKGFAGRKDASLCDEEPPCYLPHQTTGHAIRGSDVSSDKEELQDAERKRHWARDCSGQEQEQEHGSLSDGVRQADSDDNASGSSVYSTFEKWRTSGAFRKDHDADANNEVHSEKVWRTKGGYSAETSSSDDEAHCAPPIHPTGRGDSNDVNILHKSGTNEQKDASFNNGDDIRSILKRERCKRWVAYAVNKKEDREQNVARGPHLVARELVAQQPRATKEKSDGEKKLTNDTLPLSRRYISDYSTRKQHAYLTKCRKEQTLGSHYVERIADSQAKGHGNPESLMRGELQVPTRDRLPLKHDGGRSTKSKEYPLDGNCECPELKRCHPPGGSCGRHISSGSEDAAEVTMYHVRGMNDSALANEAERLLLVESLLKQGMVDEATALLAETSDFDEVPSLEQLSRASEVCGVISHLADRLGVKDISDTKCMNETPTQLPNVGDDVPPKTRHPLMRTGGVSMDIEVDEISSRTRCAEARVRENGRKGDVAWEAQLLSGVSNRVDGATRESLSGKERRSRSLASRDRGSHAEPTPWQQPEWRDEAMRRPPAEQLQTGRREERGGALAERGNPKQREETGRRLAAERHPKGKFKDQSRPSVKRSGAGRRGEHVYLSSELSEDAKREGCARSPTKCPLSERGKECVHRPAKRYETDRRGGCARLPAEQPQAKWREKRAFHPLEGTPSTHTRSAVVAQRPAEFPLVAHEMQPAHEPSRHSQPARDEAGDATWKNGSPPSTRTKERMHMDRDLVYYDHSVDVKCALATSPTTAFAPITLPPRRSLSTPQSLPTMKNTTQFATHETKPGLTCTRSRQIRNSHGTPHRGSLGDNISRHALVTESNFPAMLSCDKVPHSTAMNAETSFPAKITNSIEDCASALEWARIASPAIPAPLVVQAVVPASSLNPEDCFRKMELRAERQRQQRQLLLDAVRNCAGTDKQSIMSASY